MGPQSGRMWSTFPVLKAVKGKRPWLGIFWLVVLNAPLVFMTCQIFHSTSQLCLSFPKNSVLVFLTRQHLLKVFAKRPSIKLSAIGSSLSWNVSHFTPSPIKQRMGAKMRQEDEIIVVEHWQQTEHPSCNYYRFIDLEKLYWTLMLNKNRSHIIFMSSTGAIKIPVDASHSWPNYLFTSTPRNSVSTQP